jgi:uncharacterized protein YgiM (DUF1202 family)
MTPELLKTLSVNEMRIVERYYQYKTEMLRNNVKIQTETEEKKEHLKTRNIQLQNRIDLLFLL